MGFLPILSGVSDLGGLAMGIKNQSQQQNATGQIGNNLDSALSALSGMGSGLVGNYTANAQPALNNMIRSMPGQIGGYQGQAGGAYGQELGYAGQLGSSPYPGMIMGAGSQFMTYPNASIGDQLANAAQLSNWQGLKPKELGQATTVASDAAQSAAETMKAQMGGVANPGAVMSSLGEQAAQAGMQTGAQLGAMAQEQELGAKEAAGQEYGQVAGEQLAQVSGLTSATEAAGSQYASDLTGAGGMAGAAGSGYAGLSQQDIEQLLSALSTESGMAQAGIGASEYGASDWTSLLESAMGYNQGAGNPFSTFGSGIMSLLPYLTGGGGGGGGGGGAPPPFYG